MRILQVGVCQPYSVLTKHLAVINTDPRPLSDPQISAKNRLDASNPGKIEMLFFGFFFHKSLQRSPFQ